ncbi:hypothetical protein CSV74_05005 [Sporosarcina sp. P19]|uniref:hypothetical protein n=1 Tax=Sporosarcina sp. P19 TaxID=2048258 RepID=UPI000C163577|nr:hypothetical protein [Sporosarcina sp. P19]PIC77453.1 hypothetical protein CSV74_05005 [Sporosarcina sp. P19]
MNSQEKVEDIRKTVILNAQLEKVREAVSTLEGIAAWWMLNSRKPIVGSESVLHTEQFGDSPSKVTEFEQPHTVVRGFMESGWERIVKRNFLPHSSKSASSYSC